MKKFMVLFCFMILILFCVASNGVEANSQYIYIDPGHGGIDGGAERGGIKESTLNLEISLILKSLFEDNGYKVLMTRTGDYDLAILDGNRKREDIKERVRLINESDALIYLSIHMNTFSQSVYSGAQTFYNSNSNNSVFLANTIQDSIVKYLNNTKRKSKKINGIYLVENVRKPGCLVECGFMSNDNEFKLLQDKAYQMMLAKAIFQGSIEYLNLV